MSTHPTEAPPSYEAASSHSGPQDSSHLAVPGRNRSNSASSYTASSDEEGQDRGLSTDERLSVEDAFRPLPEGWTREFDPNSQHFFYVDTKASPPRSIWIHPFDDEEYLRAHPEHREASRLYEPPQGAPPGVASSSSAAAVPHSTTPSDEKKSHNPFSSHHQGGAAAPSSSSSSSASNSHSSSSTSAAGGKKTKTKDERTLGRKLKDKMTGSTHEQRVAQRKRQKEEEMKAYQQYIMRRNEILKAQREGRYQTVYAAPSMPYGRPMYSSGYYGSPYGSRYGGYGGGYYGRPYGGMGAGGAGLGLLGGLAVGSLLF